MPQFQVKGANLYYETFGNGPLLLMIPGANGNGAVYHDAAKYLSSKFTVVCWDRRGYSQSQLSGEQNFTDRLSVDADDASALIKHLSDEPAFVFGTSSGAIVGTQLLIRHPKKIRALVAHEPPSFALLPTEHREKASGFIDHIYNLYRTKGAHAAMETFSTQLFPVGEERQKMYHCMDTTRGHEIRANSMYWFEFELRQYTSTIQDLETIVAEKEKYIPAAGLTSGDGPGVGPVALLAGMVGKEIVRLPGGHVPYMIEPETFSFALSNLLEKVIAD